ncbi:MAG: 2Fe-2S iron-sulfur cluster-binding protein, partial [Planctomycetota bacterium]
MGQINVIVDGQTIEVEEGTPLIEACFKAGKEVPHFCYHSGLTVSGNCRMCSVKLANAQFPDKAYPMACLVPARYYKDKDGKQLPMEVVTESAEITKMQKDIMEFLLINHPLDCPQCDQAGECVLQNYAYTYGPDRSRFEEQKVIRHTKPLGPRVAIWGNRCIACDRCARFCKEVPGTGEL